MLFEGTLVTFGIGRIGVGFMMFGRIILTFVCCVAILVKISESCRRAACCASPIGLMVPGTCGCTRASVSSFTACVLRSVDEGIGREKLCGKNSTVSQSRSCLVLGT